MLGEDIVGAGELCSVGRSLLVGRVLVILGRVLSWTVATQHFLILTGAIANIPLLKQQHGLKLVGGPRP